jgi:hypothetical protein
MLRDPFQSAHNSGWWGGPQQKHSIDAVKASTKGSRKSEVSANHLDLWWQTSRVWVARHRTDLRALGHQLRENLATDGACPSNNKNMIHARPS